MNFKNYINQLETEGLIIDDKQLLNDFLKHVGPLRLEEYFHRHRNPTNKLFFPRTKFSRIVEVYIFDRRLRGLIIDAIDRIEISLKANTAFIVNDENSGKNWVNNILISNEKWLIFWEKNKDRWLKNKRCRNINPDSLISPEILVCICSLGELITFFNLIKTPLKKRIIKRMGIPSLQKFENWMNGIRHLRNKSAHHERIWNEHLTINLTAPEGITLKENNSIGSYLQIIDLLLQDISPDSSWKQRLRDLIEAFHIPVGKMDLEGFFDDFKK